MREQYMTTGEGFLIVYSVTSRDSFNTVKKFFTQILRVKDVASFPILIVGNKIDLADQRQVSTSEGKELAKSLGCRFIETSALTKTNVDEAFFELVREIRRYQRMLLGKVQEETAPKKKKNLIKSVKGHVCSIM